jgi:hypothetical protein
MNISINHLIENPSKIPAQKPTKNSSKKTLHFTRNFHKENFKLNYIFKSLRFQKNAIKNSKSVFSLNKITLRFISASLSVMVFYDKSGMSLIDDGCWLIVDCWQGCWSIIQYGGHCEIQIDRNHRILRMEISIEIRGGNTRHIFNQRFLLEKLFTLPFSIL